MTSWKLVTFLFLSGLLIDLSEEACFDYFTTKAWINLTEKNFTLAVAKDPRDVIECTLQNACSSSEDEWICSVLHCLREGQTLPTTCEGESGDRVALYHLMCLAAKVLDHTPHGCQYEKACELYPAIGVLGHTTTTTTLPTQTATLAETAATRTESGSAPGNDSHSAEKNEGAQSRVSSVPVVFLTISAILNAFLFVIILHCWCARKREAAQRTRADVEPSADGYTAVDGLMRCELCSLCAARQSQDDSVLLGNGTGELGCAGVEEEEKL